MLDELKKLPFELRIPYLIEKSIITDVMLVISSSGIRPVVVININGIKMPFYRSANGTSGKKVGGWQVFFGFGKQPPIGPLNWMVKGTIDEMNCNYKCSAISYYTNLLNESLNWDHSLDLGGKNEYFNSHITFTGSRAEFNKLIFGIEDRGNIIDIASTIAADIERINAAFKTGYYIISLSHSMRHEKYVSLWRPNNAGYCYSKAMAGIYEMPKPGYHDDENNMPVKAEDAEVLFKMLPYDGTMRPMIPNTKEIWEKLNVKMTKDGLIRKPVKTK